MKRFQVKRIVENGNVNFYVRDSKAKKGEYFCLAMNRDKAYKIRAVLNETVEQMEKDEPV